MPAKVTCPHCLRPLKMRKPPTEGHRVLCSRCGRSFRVTPELLQQSSRATAAAVAQEDTVPTPALVTDTHPSAPSLPVLSPKQAAPLSDAAARAAPAAPAQHRRLLALLILAGLAVTMLLTFLLVLYFAAHRAAPPPHEMAEIGSADDPEIRDELRSRPSLPSSKDTRSDRLSGRAPAEPALQEAWLPAEAQAQVDAAIERGIRFLRSQQDKGGSWGPQDGHHVGLAALPALTLLECGVGPDDPCIRSAAEHVRQHASQLTMTYDLALSILFLDRLGAEADRRLIRTLALRLAAGQTASGGWTYNCPLLPDKDADLLEHTLEQLRPSSPLDLFIRVPNGPVGKDVRPPGGATVDFGGGLRDPRGFEAATKDLPPPLRQLPVLQPPGKGPQALPPDGTDNSNTQFAILGLWAAGRLNLPLERSLALIVKRFRTSQSPQGGWEYNYNPQSGNMTPTMTCAGLLGLAVGHGLNASMTDPAALRRLPADPAIEKGFYALAPVIGTSTGWKKDRGKQHPLPAGGMYLMWSLERVGVLYNRRKIQGRDWYDWGAELVVDLQAPDGAWRAGGYPGPSPIADTCFGLLFLKRANLAQDLTKKLELIFEGKRVQ
jgi:hypothetical protein